MKFALHSPQHCLGPREDVWGNHRTWKNRMMVPIDSPVLVILGKTKKSPWTQEIASDSNRENDGWNGRRPWHQVATHSAKGSVTLGAVICSRPPMHMPHCLWVDPAMLPATAWESVTAGWAKWKATCLGLHNWILGTATHTIMLHGSSGDSDVMDFPRIPPQ